MKIAKLQGIGTFQLALWSLNLDQKEKVFATFFFLPLLYDLPLAIYTMS